MAVQAWAEAPGQASLGAPYETPEETQAQHREDSTRQSTIKKVLQGTCFWTVLGCPSIMSKELQFSPPQPGGGNPEGWACLCCAMAMGWCFEVGSLWTFESESFIFGVAVGRFHSWESYWDLNDTKPRLTRIN